MSSAPDPAAAISAQIHPVTPLTELTQKCSKVWRYLATFSFFQNILLLALPLYSLQVLDRVMSSHSYSTLLWLTLLMLVLLFAYILLQIARSALTTKLGDWLEIQLAPKLLSNSVQLTSIGYVTSAGQHQRDLANIKGFLSNGGLTTIFDAPFSLLSLLIIYMINVELGLVTLLGAFLLFGFGILTEFATKRLLDMASRINIKSLSIAETASRNAETIEAMGMMDNIVAHWKQYNQKHMEIQDKVSNRANLILSASRYVRFALQMAITGFGAYLALQNQLSVGGMIASSILAARTLAPFEAAISVWKQFVQARDSYKRLQQAFEQMPQFRGNMALPAPKGQVTIDQVLYRPPRSDKTIIKGVSLSINPGEMMGIIGPAGAGKSTLARMIIGILPPTAGAIRLDGADTFKWNRADFGKYVGYLPQDVELFSGTIKDNIARMDLKASPEDVYRAAMLAGAHEMILQLPRGYETEYSQHIISLSPGQRQRIGMARALYGNPRLLVLDEPNSNLDGEGERALLESLQRVKNAKITCILVAHRPSIVAFTDKILVLRNGLAELFGPREQVLQKYTSGPSSNPPQPSAGPAAGGAAAAIPSVKL